MTFERCVVVYNIYIYIYIYICMYVCMMYVFVHMFVSCLMNVHCKIFTIVFTIKLMELSLKNWNVRFYSKWYRNDEMSHYKVHVDQGKTNFSFELGFWNRTCTHLWLPKNREVCTCTFKKKTYSTRSSWEMPKDNW